MPRKWPIGIYENDAPRRRHPSPLNPKREPQGEQRVVKERIRQSCGYTAEPGIRARGAGKVDAEEFLLFLSSDTDARVHSRNDAVAVARKTS